MRRVKIAMWSGPRNLSTAMMYSFGNRTDCAVSDEPFYAAYLAATGADHPMRAEVMASQPNNAQDVADRLSGPNPDGHSIWYQKHMTHHMVAGFPLGWMQACRNVFLIRHPARVIASYRAKRETVALSDMGLREQLSLINHVRSLGQDPVIVDSAAIRAEPELMLRTLCAKLEISFDSRMLSWNAGPRVEDGVWADHWYGSVHRGTGFEAEGALPELGETEAALLAEAMPLYRAMAKWALTPASVTHGE